MGRPASERAPVRVGILGWGAIGAQVGSIIEHRWGGGDRTLELVAVASRFTSGGAHPLAVDPDELGRRCDVVVEAAGPDAVRARAETYLLDGADVLVVSLGALVDDALRARLRSAGPGRLWFTAGAIGGLDVLDAARLYGPVHRVGLTTTKPAAALVRSWMDAEMRDALERGRSDVECFRGTVAEAVRLFPESLNVSAALGLAAGRFDVVEVAVVGSSDATVNRHEIVVEAAAGRYRFSIANSPSPTNPRSSHITAWAVVRSLVTRSMVGGGFV